MVRYLGPYQTVCDDWNYWWTYLAEHFSEATAFGFAQRALLMQSNSTQPNNLATRAPPRRSNGGGARLAARAATSSCTAQTYGAAIDNQGNADCETGQRGYPKQLNAFDPQHRDFASDPHTPGRPGPDLQRPGAAFRPARRSRRAPHDRAAARLHPGEPMMRRRRGRKKA